MGWKGRRGERGRSDKFCSFFLKLEIHVVHPSRQVSKEVKNEEMVKI
jgi:hypothetical protein